MAEAPAYLILGRGRWAQRMHPIIAGESRRVSMIEETRRRRAENDSAYLSRLADAMKSSGAQIAWLCVAPGPHVSLMIQAALEADLHVVVEKPWFGSPGDTQRLQSLARDRHRLIAVHFEYLLLESVANWKKTFYPGAGLRFGGRFFQGRPDRSGISALDNLGCHLFSIYEYAVPSAEIGDVDCSYERPDERLVWLEKSGERISAINLFQDSGNIIQNFMKKVEAALTSAAFPFDLDFALRVANRLNENRIRNPR